MPANRCCRGAPAVPGVQHRARRRHGQQPVQPEPGGVRRRGGRNAVASTTEPRAGEAARLPRPGLKGEVMRSRKRQILNRAEALERTISRRRFLAGAGAAVAACAAGPGNVFAATKVNPTKAPGAPLIPPGKLGTITFTQRDVPPPDRHRGKRGVGTDSDDGLRRRARLPRGPDRPRTARAAPRRLVRAARVPARASASSRSSSPATDRTPTTPAEARRTQRPAASPPPSRARPTSPTATHFGASSTSSSSRRSATTASSRTPGRARTARAAACRPTTTSATRPSSSSHRSSACRTWAPATTRRAPTTATSSRGRSPARSGRHSTSSACSGASTSTRTTTRRHTTSSRTGRWSPSRRIA